MLFVVGTHVLIAPAWIAILVSNSVTAAFACFLASRLAYVLFAGFALRAQDESGWWTRRWGPERGYRRFRAVVLVLMHYDSVGMALVSWTSRGTLNGDVPAWAVVALGGVLVVAGVGVKTWAVRTLGGGAYFWRSFFIPPEQTRYVVAGPYRWLEHPMYTVGYAHAYGIALLARSLPGLIAALVAQALVLVLNAWAEKPHTLRMKVRGAEGAG
jgi:protein-S-isoprenylcysteine O-methyltransferase Ste14